jgi:hypothetical protein
MRRRSSALTIGELLRYGTADTKTAAIKMGLFQMTKGRREPALR